MAPAALLAPPGYRNGLGTALGSAPSAVRTFRPSTPSANSGFAGPRHSDRGTDGAASRAGTCRQQLPIERREPQAAKIELFCLSSVACRDPT